MSSFNVYFKYTNKEGIIYEFYNRNCFGNIYTIINSFLNFEIYVPIKTESNSNLCPFNEEEILLYNQLLKDCEFNFEYLGIIKGFGTEGINDEFYKYSFDIESNGDTKCKFLFNFIRYLHEQDFPEIVKNLFNINKELPNILPINKFILAHYSKSNFYNCGGHDIRGSYFIKLFTKNSYNDFLTQKYNSLYNSLPKFNTPDNSGKIYELLKDNKIKEFYELYSEQKTKLYVYGSLRKDQYNYNKIVNLFGKDSIKFIKTKIIKGYKLYDLGSYPGIKIANNDFLTIDIIIVNNKAFEYINDMEIKANYSVKINREFDAEKMYIYEGNIDNCSLVKSGDWIEYLNNDKKQLKTIKKLEKELPF